MRDLGSNGFTHRPLSSSFLGLPYRIVNIHHKKELHRGLWVELKGLWLLDCPRWVHPELQSPYGAPKTLNLDRFRAMPSHKVKFKGTPP